MQSSKSFFTIKRSFNFSSMSVLLVDDNKFMRQTIAGMCRSFGFGKVYEVDDGSEAIRVMKEHRMDIVVCDWLMEPLDGFDFTKLMRTAQDSPNPFVPIIMLTGHTEYSKVVGARDVGVTEFLAKPVSAQTLLQRLIYVCEKPRQFIRCPGFFGPDRRRRDDPSYGGPERRGKGVDPSANLERKDPDASGMDGDNIDEGWGLSPEEMEAILADGD